MKKRLLILFLLSVILVGVTGCNIAKNKLEIGDKSEYVQISPPDVSLSIKDGTLTKTGATFVLKNNDTMDCQYSDFYEIEVKQGEDWHKINIILDFDLVSYDLKEGETKEIDLNWKDSYGKLPSGQYRIIKEVCTDEKKSAKFYVFAEFSIK